jgi:UDP-4-amino-4,6-dideoxy-N-acetyl-beta-L-altrosamine N-acetyltransferase
MTRVSLRPMTETDSPQVHAWRNLPDVRRNMYTDHIITAEEHARWFPSALTAADRRYWMIVCDGEPVGVANLADISPRHGRCSFGIYLGPADLRGKGVGRAALFLLQREAFDRLGLRKLCCEVLDFNTQALQLYLGLGFVQEGRLRAHIVKETGPCDVIQLAMLDADWQQRQGDFAKQLAGRGIMFDDPPAP